ncbi:phosphogluconate dehydrogenase C-terminal domain-containing protein, partial [Paenibacillus sp.]|uniref:phosphogluconate dehydrogenase C-terminal domain-containing protein n=1 Tax=Paenibacillus sp. TaxID=58172 RepID=UPI002D31C033
NDETTPEAKRDFFGGVAAKQAIVCALMQGPEEHYAVAEAVAQAMYAPILRTHRITVEQMAMLEPTMAETISSMMVTVLGEAMDEAVKRGVPYEAAKDFMLGHINVQLAIVFEKTNPFSDACLVAIEYGKKAMLKDNWRDLYNPEKVYDQIDVMLHPEKLPAKLEEL